MRYTISQRIKGLTPNKWDLRKIDKNQYTRACGDTLCNVCGQQYFKHPYLIGFEWLNKTCDNKLYKL